MAKSWDGYDIVCKCGSENIESLPDENCGSMDDYQCFRCLDCGHFIRIELPN